MVVVLWGYFYSARAGNMVRVDGEMLEALVRILLYNPC